MRDEAGDVLAGWLERLGKGLLGYFKELELLNERKALAVLI